MGENETVKVTVTVEFEVRTGDEEEAREWAKDVVRDYLGGDEGADVRMVDVR